MARRTLKVSPATDGCLSGTGPMTVAPDRRVLEQPHATLPSREGRPVQLLAPGYRLYDLTLILGIYLGCTSKWVLPHFFQIKVQRPLSFF